MCNNLESMIYTKELIYDEFVDLLDINFFAGSTNG